MAHTVASAMRTKHTRDWFDYGAAIRSKWFANEFHLIAARAPGPAARAPHQPHRTYPSTPAPDAVHSHIQTASVQPTTHNTHTLEPPVRTENKHSHQRIALSGAENFHPKTELLINFTCVWDFGPRVQSLERARNAASGYVSPSRCDQTHTYTHANIHK